MSASAPEPTTTTPAAAPSRRTVLRTAAWAAPAITLATAAPAFASSTVTLPINEALTTFRLDGINLRADAALSPTAGTTIAKGSKVTFTFSSGLYGVPPESVTCAGTNWTFSVLTAITGGSRQIVATAADGASTTLTVDQKYPNGTQKPKGSHTLRIVTHLPNSSQTATAVRTI